MTKSYTRAGDFTKALAYADKLLDLYDAKKHRHLLDILYNDLKTIAGSCGSMSTWILGYPDRARRLNDEKDAHAYRIGHPFGAGAWSVVTETLRRCRNGPATNS